MHNSAELVDRVDESDAYQQRMSAVLHQGRRSRDTSKVSGLQRPSEASDFQIDYGNKNIARHKLASTVVERNVDY